MKGNRRNDITMPDGTRVRRQKKSNLPSSLFFPFHVFSLQLMSCSKISFAVCFVTTSESDESFCRHSLIFFFVWLLSSNSRNTSSALTTAFLTFAIGSCAIFITMGRKVFARMSACRIGISSLMRSRRIIRC